MNNDHVMENLAVWQARWN